MKDAGCSMWKGIRSDGDTGKQQSRSPFRGNGPSKNDGNKSRTEIDRFCPRLADGKCGILPSDTWVEIRGEGSGIPSWAVKKIFFYAVFLYRV
jgi:hypothetical protein